MLDTMRKQRVRGLTYLLFAIIIVVFIINFGPQSGGGCERLQGTAATAAEVDGDAVPSQAFRYAFMLMGGAGQPTTTLKMRRFKETVMDRLIERELFAQEAVRMGFSVSDDDVYKTLLDGRIVALGMPISVPRLLRNGVFNYDQFKSFVQYELGMSVDAFLEQQKRDTLAQRMREFLRNGVTVSNEELQTSYQTKSLQINLEYLRFPVRKFETAVQPTEAELSEYLTREEKKLRETYERRKQMYTDMPEETKVRQILVKAPAEDQEEAARKRAEAIAARLAKGEPFADVARQVSEDEETRATGGDLGWRRQGMLGLDENDEKKLFEAKPGAVVGPLKTSGGFVLLTRSETRKGTQSFDQVKRELAEEQIKQERARALAKQKAEAATTAARGANDKTLKELFAGGAQNTSAGGDGKGNDAASKAARAKRKGESAQAAAATDLRAEETGLFSRRGNVIEGIGESADMAKAAFALTAADPVAGPFEVAGSYVVVRLKERKEPDPAEFEKTKDDLRREAELVKWQEVVTDWGKARCDEAQSAHKIEVTRELLRYEDSPKPPPYEPCSDGGPLRQL